MNVFLDTSALASHALKQPGAEEVQAFITDEANSISISALSLFELAGVLKKEGFTGEIAIYWETYRRIAEVIPVDAALAQAAWELREKLGARIPMADAVIAATAQSLGATLVHRDQHLASIPESLIPQFRLPAE